MRPTWARPSGVPARPGFPAPAAAQLPRRAVTRPQPPQQPPKAADAEPAASPGYRPPVTKAHPPARPKAEPGTASSSSGAPQAAARSWSLPARTTDSTKGASTPAAALPGSAKAAGAPSSAAARSQSAGPGKSAPAGAAHPRPATPRPPATAPPGTLKPAGGANPARSTPTGPAVNGQPRAGKSGAGSSAAAAAGPSAPATSPPSSATRVVPPQSNAGERPRAGQGSVVAPPSKKPFSVFNSPGKRKIDEVSSEAIDDSTPRPPKAAPPQGVVAAQRVAELAKKAVQKPKQPNASPPTTTIAAAKQPVTAPSPAAAARNGSSGSFGGGEPPAKVPRTTQADVGKSGAKGASPAQSGKGGAPVQPAKIIPPNKGGAAGAQPGGKGPPQPLQPLQPGKVVSASSTLPTPPVTPPAGKGGPVPRAVPPGRSGAAGGPPRRDPKDIKDDVQIEKMDKLLKQLLDAWTSISPPRKEEGCKLIAQRFVARITNDYLATIAETFAQCFDEDGVEDGSAAAEEEEEATEISAIDTDGYDYTAEAADDEDMQAADAVEVEVEDEPEDESEAAEEPPQVSPESVSRLLKQIENLQPKDWHKAFIASDISKALEAKKVTPAAVVTALAEAEEPELGSKLALDLCSKRYVQTSDVNTGLQNLADKLEDLVEEHDEAWHKMSYFITNLFPKTPSTPWGWNQIGWNWNTWWMMTTTVLERADKYRAFDVLVLVLQMMQEKSPTDVKIKDLQVWKETGRMAKIRSVLTKWSGGTMEEAQIMETLGAYGVELQGS